MNKNIKFGLIIAVILGTLGWLAAGGINQTASYYKEIAELQKLGPRTGSISACAWAAMWSSTRSPATDATCILSWFRKKMA